MVFYIIVDKFIIVVAVVEVGVVSAAVDDVTAVAAVVDVGAVVSGVGCCCLCSWQPIPYHFSVWSHCTHLCCYACRVSCGSILLRKVFCTNA